MYWRCWCCEFCWIQLLLDSRFAAFDHVTEMEVGLLQNVFRVYSDVRVFCWIQLLLDSRVLLDSSFAGFMVIALIWLLDGGSWAFLEQNVFLEFIQMYVSRWVELSVKCEFSYLFRDLHCAFWCCWDRKAHGWLYLSWRLWCCCGFCWIQVLLDSSFAGFKFCWFWLLLILIFAGFNILLDWTFAGFKFRWIQLLVDSTFAGFNFCWRCWCCALAYRLLKPMHLTGALLDAFAEKRATALKSALLIWCWAWWE